MGYLEALRDEDSRILSVYFGREGTVDVSASVTHGSKQLFVRDLCADDLESSCWRGGGGRNRLHTMPWSA